MKEFYQIAVRILRSNTDDPDELARIAGLNKKLLFDSVNFRSADLRAIDLSGIDIASCNIENAKLTKSQLKLRDAQLLEKKHLRASLEDQKQVVRDLADDFEEWSATYNGKGRLSSSDVKKFQRSFQELKDKNTRGLKRLMEEIDLREQEQYQIGTMHFASYLMKKYGLTANREIYEILKTNSYWHRCGQDTNNPSFGVVKFSPDYFIGFVRDESGAEMARLNTVTKHFCSPTVELVSAAIASTNKFKDALAIVREYRVRVPTVSDGAIRHMANLIRNIDDLMDLASTFPIEKIPEQKIYRFQNLDGAEGRYREYFRLLLSLGVRFDKSAILGWLNAPSFEEICKRAEISIDHSPELAFEVLSVLYPKIATPSDFILFKELLEPHDYDLTDFETTSGKK